MGPWARVRRLKFKMQDPDFIRRNVLENVNNLDLNIRRAKRLWKAEDTTERDFAHAKDEFSKTKFTYLELSSKNQFILSIVENSGTVSAASELEESLAQSKAVLKKSKGRCKALKTELENLLVEVCRKDCDLQAEARSFASDDFSVDSAPSSSETDSILQDLKQKIEEKQALLDEQESKICELNKQKSEVELTVKGLESKLSSNAPLDHSRLIARRMLSWYQKANEVIQGICGVEEVGVKESEVNIPYFDFSCFVRGITFKFTGFDHLSSFRLLHTRQREPIFGIQNLCPALAV